MLDVIQERAVLLIHCLPVVPVHLGVIEVLTLNPPGLTVDLRPLGARINQRLKLRDIDRSVAYLCRAVRRHDTPAPTGGRRLLIQKFFLSSEACMTGALQERTAARSLSWYRCNRSPRHHRHPEHRSV